MRHGLIAQGLDAGAHTVAWMLEHHHDVILLVADLDIRVIHAATGEILRHLTLDPTKNYQPTGQPPGKPPQPEPEPQ